MQTLVLPSQIPLGYSRQQKKRNRNNDSNLILRERERCRRRWPHSILYPKVQSLLTWSISFPKSSPYNVNNTSRQLPCLTFSFNSIYTQFHFSTILLINKYSSRYISFPFQSSRRVSLSFNRLLFFPSLIYLYVYCQSTKWLFFFLYFFADFFSPSCQHWNWKFKIEAWHINMFES